MQQRILKKALESIPAGFNGGLMVRGTPIEVTGFNWKLEPATLEVDPYLMITQETGEFAIVEIANIDWFYTYPIPKTKAKR